MSSPPFRRGARAWLAALAVFTLAIGLLFAPALSPGAQFLYRDAGRMHHPAKRMIAKALAEGRLPQWNPLDGMGTPLVGDPIHAVQHPFNAFLLVLPFEAGFKAWVLASCLAAALGAFALARLLGAGTAGGIAAGIAFGLSGFVVSSTDNLTYLTGAGFLPWVLATALAFVRSGGAARALGLLAASFACAAAGDPVSWALAVGAGPALALALAAGDRRRAALRAATAFAVGAAGGAPVVVPLLAWIPHSARAAQTVLVPPSLWNLHPGRLLELAIPHLSRDPSGDTSNEVMRVFAGSPPGYGTWLLSVYAGATVLLLAWSAGGSRPVRLLAAGAAAGAWAAMGPYAGFAAVAARLPLLSGVRFWEKLAVWPALFIAVAAGLGAARVLAETGAARSLARRGAVLALAAAAGWAAASLLPIGEWLGPRPESREAAEMLAANLVEGTLHAALLAGVLAAIAFLVARGRLAGLAPAALVVAILADLVGANVRAYRLAEPPGPLPASALGRRVLEADGLPAVFTPWPLASPSVEPGLAVWQSKWRRGARRLYPSWNAAEGARNAIPYSALQPSRYAQVDELYPAELRVAALGLFGVQSVVVPGPPERLAGTALAGPWEVLGREEDGASLVAIPHRPRAYLAASVRRASEREAFAFAGDASRSAGPETVVEAEVPPGLTGGEASVVRDEPEAVTVRTVSPGPALLVLNDALAHGWTATIDGRPAVIHPANFAARGVFVGAGEHEVAFTYRTPGLGAGWAVAGACLALVLAIAAVEARRGGREPNPPDRSP